jgi:DNA-directed RNA polymerase specialized sigma54-like protein
MASRLSRSRSLNSKVSDRRYKEAMHIIITHCTTRECAKEFKVNQSTISRDMNNHYLKKYYPMLHARLQKIFQENHTTHKHKKRSKK